MLIYLDLCSFNRPFDDQSNVPIRLESEAKLFIQQLVRDKKLDLVWSAMLDYENQFNPVEAIRHKIAEWKQLAVIDVDADDHVKNVQAELVTLGIKHKDALHVACAITAGTDYFITVDKRLLNKPIRGIVLQNPLSFIEQYQNGNDNIME